MEAIPLPWHEEDAVTVVTDVSNSVNVTDGAELIKTVVEVTILRSASLQQVSMKLNSEQLRIDLNNLKCGHLIAEETRECQHRLCPSHESRRSLHLFEIQASRETTKQKVLKDSGR